MEAAIGIVPPEIAVLVRVAENSAAAVGQALDAGAEGVIVPLVESAREARRAVSFARFPPHGIRSGGGFRPLADFISYTEAAERGTVVMVMIETAKGVKKARAIAEVEGVDMVFIGTGDLALSLGTFPNNDARHEDACEAVRRACRAAWTPCGIFTPNIEAAVERRGQGLSHGRDCERYRSRLARLQSRDRRVQRPGAGAGAERLETRRAGRAPARGGAMSPVNPGRALWRLNEGERRWLKC